MKNKILKNMCITLMLSIVFTALIIRVLAYQRLESQMEKWLAKDAMYISTGIQDYGYGYLDKISRNINNKNQNRITIIHPDGKVVYDSFENPDTMDNHKDRPEVVLAIQNGYGKSTRMSKTLSERTHYYAVKLSDSNILRVAITTSSMLTIILQMLPWMIVIMIVLFIVYAVIAELMTKNIVDAINRIDLDHPEECNCYDELTPFISKIVHQNNTIAQQIETLRRKQNEFTAITENMSEGFIVVDKKADVVSYNLSAMRLLGVEKNIGNNIKISVLNFNRSKAFTEAVDEALSGVHSERKLDVYGKHYQIIANPSYENSSVAGAVIVILDITEKENAENIRREFTANVSHELKTPLTSISGYAELIKNGMVKEKDVERFAGNIYTEAQRLITLIEDIINLSQLDEGMKGTEKTEVDLYEIAKDVISRLSLKAEEKKITLNLMGEKTVINGSAQIIDEMIYNICDNAIKYNHEGGEVKIQIGKTGEYSYIEVKDTGIGIADADTERIFERFYRVDKSHSKKIGGTGLGLSIVKHGAIYHGAHIEVKSELGKGTDIRIMF